MAIKASQRALITVVWYANEDEGSGGMPSKTKTSLEHTWMSESWHWYYVKIKEREKER